MTIPISDVEELQTVLDSKEVIGVALALVVGHEGKFNPHPTYQLTTQKNTPDGYAGLDGSGKLSGSQQLYGTIVNTACQGNDGRLINARVPLPHDHEVGELLSLQAALDGREAVGVAATLVAAHVDAPNPHPGALTVGALADHEAAANPHPGYLTPAEGDAAYEPLGTVATHAAAADPHTGYQKESERNAVNGYAGLDSSSKLTGSQQVYGTTADTACEGNDSRFATIPVIALARVTADRTTTSTTLAAVTDLAIPIGANETWSFESYINGGCSAVNGSQFSVTVPAGATLRAGFHANTGAVANFSYSQSTTDNGPSTIVWNANAQNRMMQINGVVINGVNAGAIQVNFKSDTAGNTTTVNVNSYITGRRH